MQPDAAREAADRAWNRGLRPDPRRTVSEWADGERWLGPEEGPFAGRWRTGLTPYLREPMDCMTLSHPSIYVTLKACSQVGKSSCGLNLLGQVAAETPAGVLLVLPTIDEARAFNRDKLQPMIDNSPAVRGRISDIKRADESSSTTMFKRFPGGSIELTGANSSKGLQMRTKRVVLLEEVAEFPFDVDGRGDPVSMAEARTVAYQKIRKAKIVKVSTPAIMNACRITTSYGASSKGLYHVPCPHCGHRQALVFSQLKYSADDPELAGYACVECGGLAQEHHKRAMLADGVWVHERPELVVTHAGFALNALYSPFVTWGWVALKREESKGDPSLDKVFTQQVLGEAYEQRHDVVPHVVLWQRRTAWAANRLPADILFLEAATDVQGDRLEWGIYGFDRDFGMWWIDGGILEGDPTQPAVWAAHDVLLARRWTTAWGDDLAPESWGVDSGYMSQHVYAYVRRHAHHGAPRVMALDGRPRWGEPPVGTPKIVDIDFAGRKIGAVQLWPVGTWDLKTELYGAMRLTEMGPDGAGVWPKGAMRFPERLDLGFFEQLTAEAVVVHATRAGFERREWVKVRGRNEQLDLAVYCRALARRDTIGFDEARWAALAAKRQPEGEPELLARMHGGTLMTPAPARAAEAVEIETPAPAAIAARRVSRSNYLGRIGR